jgi:hypothetical protein
MIQLHIFQASMRKKLNLPAVHFDTKAGYWKRHYLPETDGSFFGVYKTIQQRNSMTLSKPLFDYLMGYTEKAVKQAHADIHEAFSHQFHPASLTRRDSVAVSVYTAETTVEVDDSGEWGQRIPREIPLIAILEMWCMESILLHKATLKTGFLMSLAHSVLPWIIKLSVTGGNIHTQSAFDYVLIVCFSFISIFLAFSDFMFVLISEVDFKRRLLLQNKCAQLLKTGDLGISKTMIQAIKYIEQVRESEKENPEKSNGVKKESKVELVPRHLFLSEELCNMIKCLAKNDVSAVNGEGVTCTDSKTLDKLYSYHLDMTNPHNINCWYQSRKIIHDFGLPFFRRITTFSGYYIIYVVIFGVYVILAKHNFEQLEKTVVVLFLVISQLFSTSGVIFMILFKGRLIHISKDEDVETLIHKKIEIENGLYRMVKEAGTVNIDKETRFKRGRSIELLSSMSSLIQITNQETKITILGVEAGVSMVRYFGTLVVTGDAPCFLSLHATN